jgi:membrane-anchored glycerophosphoryl diester phosphodiesterase (GDPDase)
MRSLLKNTHGMLSLGVVIVIAVIFVVLMFMAYLIYTLKTMLNPTGDALATTNNITKGFDQAVNFMVIAVIILIVALAIGAFFSIRGGRGD